MINKQEHDGNKCESYKQLHTWTLKSHRILTYKGIIVENRGFQFDRKSFQPLDAMHYRIYLAKISDRE